MNKAEAFSKEILFLNIAQVIHKQDDAPTKLAAAFEKSFTRMLSTEYIDYAGKAVKSALGVFKRRPRNVGTATAITRAVSRAMLPYGGDVAPEIRKQVATFYGAASAQFTGSLRVAKATIEPTVGFTLSLRDKKAIEAIQKLSVQTAGTYFPTQVEGKVAQVVEAVVLNDGLSTADAAVRLQAELEGALGLEASAAIPTQFATNPQFYFQILAENASVQATSISRLSSMSDAGVEKFRVEAIIDKRTSNICTELNGREFSVGGAVKAIDAFISAESIVDVQKILPFNNKDEVPKWADSGIGFPPYHLKCRSTVVPVF